MILQFLSLEKWNYKISLHKKKRKTSRQFNTNFEYHRFKIQATSIYDFDLQALLRAAIKNNDIRLASVQRSNAMSSQKTVLYRNHREDRVRVVAREKKSRGIEK